MESSEPSSTATSSYNNSTLQLLVIGGNEKFHTFLKKHKFRIETFSMSTYYGVPSPRQYHAVILLHDGSAQEDMPLAGQTELRNCISEGSIGVVLLEFVGYLVEKYKLNSLQRFFPLVRTSGITPTYENCIHKITAPTHPLFNSPPSVPLSSDGTSTSTWPTLFQCLYSGSVVRLKENAIPLIEHRALGTALAVVHEPTRIAHFSGCPTYNSNRLFDSWETCMTSIFIAAIYWVAPMSAKYQNEFLENEQSVMCADGLVNDLRKAFNNESESDVTFVLEDDRRTYASKWLLSLRSEHFRAMLKGPMKESQQKEIQLVDVKYESFLGILEYMYTDSLSFDTLSTDAILDIMLLSDRFLLQPLKLLCENYLIRNLNVNNVIPILLAASKSNAEAIKQKAMTFVVSNKKDLQDTKDFEALSTEPQLLLDIIKLL